MTWTYTFSNFQKWITTFENVLLLFAFVIKHYENKLVLHFVMLLKSIYYLSTFH